jgi:hypothetical protein
MKVLFLAFFCLLVSSCGVERTLYQPFQLEERRSDDDSKFSDLNLGQSTDSSVTNSDLQKMDLEDLLDQFYNSFVDVSDEGNYSSSIHFDSLYQLKKTRDSKFNQLEGAILEKLESPDALKGRSAKSKIAFYINAYNFLLIRLVYLNYYQEGNKLQSISELNKGRSRRNIYHSKLFYLAGKSEVSLYNILAGENESILSLSGNKDARVLFAVNCLTNSCPVFLNQAYREEKLDDQLDFVSGNSLKSSKVLSYDNQRSLLSLSHLFKDYSSNFEQDNTHRNYKNFIKYYTGIVVPSNASFKYLDFDWTLNNSSSSTPVTLDNVQVPNANTQEDPCQEFTSDNAFSPRAVCQLVLRGEDPDYKYNVERAKICILRNEKAENKKDIALRLVGNLEEIDEDNKIQRTLIDLKIKKDDTEIEKNDEDNGLKKIMTRFSHKAREISEGNTTLETFQGNFRSFQLTVKQRYRFFSMDMFKKKKQRHFTLGCDLISN